MHAGATHFLVQALGEAGDVGLRRCIHRQPWSWLKAGDTADIEQIAVAARHHHPKRSATQPGQRRNVERDLIGRAIGIERVERTGRAEAGIVHDQIDRSICNRHAGLDQRQPAPGREVCVDHFHMAIPTSEIVEPVTTARNDHHADARLPQQVSHCLADTARRTRDQRRPEWVRAHREFQRLAISATQACSVSSDATEAAGGIQASVRPAECGNCLGVVLVAQRLFRTFLGGQSTGTVDVD